MKSGWESGLELCHRSAELEYLSNTYGVPCILLSTVNPKDQIPFSKSHTLEVRGRKEDRLKDNNQESSMYAS